MSGMRISEAVGLKLQDVDLDTGVLSVHGSKFGQSRLVPVHTSTQKALSDFKEFRDCYLNEHEFDSEYFFTTCSSWDWRTCSSYGKGTQKTIYIVDKTDGRSIKGLDAGAAQR